MKIVSLQAKRYRRAFRKPLITSHGPISERTGWIIRAENEDGMAGFGEAADSLPGFGKNDTNSVESDQAVLKQLEVALPDVEFDTLWMRFKELIKICPDHASPAMRFGFETAVCDVAARKHEIPLSEWISPFSPSAVPVNYLLPSPVDDWGLVKAEISTCRYPAVKIKVGAGEIADDVATVKKLRTMLDYSPAIRLDANQAWDYDTALAVLDVMSEYDIEYVEEPLKVFDYDLLMRLKEETGIEMAIDESLTLIDDIYELLSRKGSLVLILKPSLLGHILTPRHITLNAGVNDCRAVITSNLETEIGIAAQLHLAASSWDQKETCGLDTLRLFRRGNPALMQVTDGVIKLPSGSGIGDGIGEEIWDNL